MPHPWKKLHDLVNSTLRYKLFALVLLPTLVAMMATLGFTVYWLDSYNRDNLSLKAKTDLAQARQAIQQVASDRYLGVLQHLANSYDFQSHLRRGDRRALVAALHNLEQTEGFSFIHITGELGNWLYEKGQTPYASSKPTPLTERAMRGFPGTALEVFSEDDLRRENVVTLTDAAGGNGGDLARRSPNPSQAGSALVLRAVCPVTDRQGNVLAVLDGGVILNHNQVLVNAVRDRIFGAGALPPGGSGAVALTLDDVYVSSNLPSAPRASLSADKIAAVVRRHVLEDGQTWVSRDLLGGNWYVSGYTPIFDDQGQGIGVLQTAFLEAPFRHSQDLAAAALLVILLAIFSVCSILAFRGAKRILKPIEQMMTVVRATQAGLDRRIGDIDSQDELRELARQFDAMLDLLQQRNQEIRRAADNLEVKVEERTRELALSNADLKATVNLLNKTRQQLILAEKLAAVGELAAGVAHEIHNPAAVIVGNLELLEGELGSAAKPVRAEINLIMEQVERIRHIVNRLLRFVRPTAASGRVEEVDVNDIISNVLPLVRHLMDKKSINILRNLSATASVRIDAYDLEEVLINLLINASHAMPQGGTIELRTRDVGQEAVVISVYDNGVGISPDKLNRIFDPFFTTDPQHRTGLGLSVSYSLIRRYGGDITVESEPGKGSVFHVRVRRQPLYEVQSERQSTQFLL